ncbi:MAG: hypothetical protein L0346_35905, partial [Chloroflexi bacterium]|nr:hypothetical protein [Chloroflexota bacterium]
MLRLMYMFLYADLKLPGAISNFEKIIKQVIKHAYYREILAAKLSVYYSSKHYMKSERLKIENILADIALIGQDTPRSISKTQIINELRKNAGDVLFQLASR